MTHSTVAQTVPPISISTHFPDATPVTPRERRLISAVYRLSWALLVPAPATRTTIETGCLVVDLLGDTVAVDGRRVQLSRMEWDLVALLARHVGEPVEHDRAIRWIWTAPVRAPGRRCVWPASIGTLRWLVERTRRRLGPAGYLIGNVPGVGYYLADHPVVRGMAP